jgi:hypothetical protein
MENKLIEKQAEDKGNFNKLAKALNYLNDAAELLEKSKMNKQADEITKIISNLSKTIKGSK